MAKLMIDDTRVLSRAAQTGGWHVLRMGEDLPAWIEAHGWPESIALDYDLDLGGGSWDGARVARWLLSAWETTGRPAGEFPAWDVHSRDDRNNADVERILAVFAGKRHQGLAPLRRS
jgi:hypothetical protein